MRFTKMQGCGNDYIYVDCFSERVERPEELAREISDRHFGVGGDGLILIERSGRADAYMHMFNQDGSEGNMCGNGIRCTAKYLYEHGLIPKERREVLIDTKSGIRKLSLRLEDGKVREVTVDMGRPGSRASSRRGSRSPVCRFPLSGSMSEIHTRFISWRTIPRSKSGGSLLSISPASGRPSSGMRGFRSG